MRARAFLLLTALAASCDPVHDDAVAALGPEVPGVPRGPLHRPGQPCLLCHDGTLGGPPAFSIAGTVFQNANSLAPQVGAVVTLVDASGKTVTATTNAAGSFYFDPSAFSPKFPVHVTSVAVGATSVAMHSHIGGDGSCAHCHMDPAGPDSPGHVYFDTTGVSP